eukprot:02593.XXX_90850_90978_1 [CDS] Oithona nana genome sequencing.
MWSQRMRCGSYLLILEYHKKVVLELHSRKRRCKQYLLHSILH